MDNSQSNEARKTHSPRTSDFDVPTPSGNNSVTFVSPSSSSSPPSLDGHFNPFIDDKEDRANLGMLSTSSSSTPSHFNPFRDDTDLPTSTFPASSSSSNIPDSAPKMEVPTTESPSVQIMERVSDGVSPYRIPDYVFQRNKSRAPKEWGTASNESLFSIQMGNMSFTGDLFMYNKSGELGKRKSQELSMHRKSGELTTHESNKSSEFGAYNYSGELGYSKSVDPGWYNLSGELATLGQTMSKSGQITNSCSGPHPQVTKLNSAVANNPFVSPGLGQGVGATMGGAAGTIKDAARENEKKHNFIESPSLAFGLNSPSTASCMDERSSSTKSFTFPVLAKPEISPTSSKQSSNQPNMQQQQHPSQQSQTPPTANTTSTVANTTQKRSSFSCFFCCPLRSSS